MNRSNPKMKRYAAKFKETVAYDLDGTLAQKVETNVIFDPSVIGPPIPKVVNRLKADIANGKSVIIFTARASDPSNVPYIQQWCVDNLGVLLPVTNQKTSDVELIIDDKAENPYVDLNALDGVMNIQLNDPANKTDEYMKGLSNGLIVAKSVITGEEPRFLERYARVIK